MATVSLQAADLFNVKGLVAVITGGGSGIGLMMARTLALNGAHKVYIIGRRQSVLEAASKSVSTNNIIPVVGDVLSRDSLTSAVSHITSDVGYINLFIANSGIAGPQAALSNPLPPNSTLQDFIESWSSVSMEEYEKTFKMNVSAVWFSIMAFLPLLERGNERRNVTQRSQVLATSSLAGFNRMAPSGFAYGQSKAATTHLMKQLASNLAPYQIRSNVLAPGLFPSEAAAAITRDSVFPIEKIPLQRAGTEEEMGVTMPFTEFVVPTLKTDPETEKTFMSELAPFLIHILDTHANAPKFKCFGKILVENGKDVSGEFRLVVGVEWADQSHFDSFVAGKNFQIFKDRVLPYSQALPVPQLYATDLEPGVVFGNALTEVWQVKIGDGNEKAAQAKKAWGKFVNAVAEADSASGKGKSFHGISLNLEERRWSGALGWESGEIREKVLGSTAVKEAKQELDVLVWNTFLAAFSK
ncbi:short chain dehydrogenase reductase [Stagonosporopsis vannaccii]|nr:short chain dehydrogenase reductase [Stagonosporopsis vannaccii]